MNIVLMGVPGAGKGTQATFLVDQYNMSHISTGDLLREAVDNDTNYGKQANEFMTSGQLVPDSLIINILREKLENTDISNGVVLDGFPRTLDQAKSLDSMMSEIGSQIDKAILINAETSVIIQRICSRKMCKNCGFIGSVYGLTEQEAANYVCPECGGEMFTREDDNEKTVYNRVEVYLEKTTPVISYYESQNKLVEVDGGHGCPQDIFEEIKKLLD